MAYTIYFYGTPVFNSWLGVPNNAYGIDVYGYVVSPVIIQTLGPTPGRKTVMVRFPVNVASVFLYAYVEGRYTEPIYIGFDIPSHIVYFMLVGVKP